MTKVRPIPGFSGYLVDECGAVFSDRGKARRKLKPWFLKGYEVVSLRRDGKTQKMLVNRIVALAFHGEPPTLRHEARHIDGNQRNNHQSNIAWGTHAENMADMVRHGRQGPKNHPERMARGDRHPLRIDPSLAARGSRAGGAKLTEETVSAIKAAIASGERISDLARDHGVTVQAIWNIKERKTWRHVA